MTIHFKYEVGDGVYTIHGNKVFQTHVRTLHFIVGRGIPYQKKYTLDGVAELRDEDQIFATKEELCLSLLK